MHDRKPASFGEVSFFSDVRDTSAKRTPAKCAPRSNPRCAASACSVRGVPLQVRVHELGHRLRDGAAAARRVLAAQAAERHPLRHRVHGADRTRSPPALLRSRPHRASSPRPPLSRPSRAPSAPTHAERGAVRPAPPAPRPRPRARPRSRLQAIDLEPHLELNFKRGLASAALSTDAWVRPIGAAPHYSAPRRPHLAAASARTSVRAPAPLLAGLHRWHRHGRDGAGGPRARRAAADAVHRRGAVAHDVAPRALRSGPQAPPPVPGRPTSTHTPPPPATTTAPVGRVGHAALAAQARLGPDGRSRGGGGAQERRDARVVGVGRVQAGLDVKHPTVRRRLPGDGSAVGWLCWRRRRR
jgi:hypothetical protein